MNIEESVFEFIEQEQPVDQERVVSEFGGRGLDAIRSLMINDRISYGLEYRLIIDNE